MVKTSIIINLIQPPIYLGGFKFTTMRNLIAIPNESDLTFTLQFEDGTTYQTTPMTKEEFEDAEYNTNGDWLQFLNTGSYHKA